MKTSFLTVCILLFINFLTVFGQSDVDYVTTTLNVSISSTNFASARLDLNNYFNSNAIKIINQDETTKSLDVDFSISESQYKSVDELLNKLGYVLSKKVTTINNQNKVKELEHELNYLKEKKKSYYEMLSKMDEKSENYYSFWRDIKAIEQDIYEKEKEMLLYTQKTNGYLVNLNVEEERTTPEDSRVSFVNMPGVEYSYLKTESPLKGTSASVYQGYFVKYMFTRGKSYVTAGAYKAQNIAKGDSLTYSEMFTLAFGQDFYTRHLGRGARKFLNLYSGYTVGGIMATSSSRKSNIFYISPSIGVELFKNKYMLIDTRVAYFIPFSNNRNLRGLSYNAAFNFVF
jgi:hypothetical protein